MMLEPVCGKYGDRKVVRQVCQLCGSSKHLKGSTSAAACDADVATRHADVATRHADATT